MSDTLLQSTLRELHTLVRRPRLWLVFALMIGLFSMTGPFGTYERLPFVSRLGYWLTMNTATWASALICNSFVKAALITRVPHQLTRIFIGGALSALPVGLAITAINGAVVKSPFNLTEFAENAFVSLPIAIGFSLLVWLSLSAGEPAADENGPPQAAPIPDAKAPAHDPVLRPAPSDRPALLDRLPVSKRGALVRIEVQDHYVLAVTAKGREMLLMRLADAIAETGPATGMQVHRSHWVAFDAVEGLERGPGKTPRLMLVMSDGAKVPVSRSFAAAVRARFAETSRPI